MMDLGPNFSLEENFYDENSEIPKIGTQVENYRIEFSLLDKPTRYSLVYLCTDINNGKEKVLKFIKFYRHRVSAIVNEISTMRIASHPNIIPLERYFRYKDYACIVIPYTKHRSLIWHMIKFYKGGMPSMVACSLFKQMLEAVAHIHQLGIWHRDIKPDNFLLFDPVEEEKDEDVDSETEDENDSIEKVEIDEKSDNDDDGKSGTEKSAKKKSCKKKSDSDKSDSDKSDSDKSDTVKRKSKKSAKKKSHKKKGDSDKNDSDKNDSDKSDSDKNDSDKSDTEKRKPKKSAKKKSHKKKSDSDKSDSDKNDSDESDIKKRKSKKSVKNIQPAISQANEIDTMTSKLSIVLSDFGFAQIFGKEEVCKEYMGTPEYVAPELANKKQYNNKVDVWALGVSLFVMLTGRFPVPSSKKFRIECIEKTKKGDLNFELLNRMKIDQDAIDLIRKMCTFDPSERITVQQALDHVWIKSLTHEKTRLESAVQAAIGVHDDDDFVPQT